jgi:hypothetical protein
VTVTAYSTHDSLPYAEMVAITVEAEGNTPPPQQGTTVTAANIGSVLDGLDDNEADRPYTLAFDGSINVNGAEWTGAIKTALAASTKYVVLDLSACSAGGNNVVVENYITGASSVTEDMAAGYFNTIAYGNGGTCIIGIIFPECLTGIGKNISAGFSALERVTIPEGVSALAINSFNTCSNLERITIKNSNMMSVHTKAVSEAFKTYYDAQDPDYAGVYTLSDGNWTRTDLP